VNLQAFQTVKSVPQSMIMLFELREAQGFPEIFRQYVSLVAVLLLRKMPDASKFVPLGHRWRRLHSLWISLSFHGHVYQVFFL